MKSRILQDLGVVDDIYRRVIIKVPTHVCFYCDTTTKCVIKQLVEYELDYISDGLGENSFENYVLANGYFVRQYFNSQKYWMEKQEGRNPHLKETIKEAIPYLKENIGEFSLIFNNYVRIPYMKRYYVTPKIIEVRIKDDKALRKYKIFQLNH